MLKRFLGLGLVEACTRALNWGMGLVLAFILDVKTFGMIALFIAIEALLIAVYTLGMDRALLRFMPEQNKLLLLSKVSKTWLINGLIISGVLLLFIIYSEYIRDSFLAGISVVDSIYLIIIIFAAAYRSILCAFFRSLGNIWGFAVNRLGIQLIRVISITAIALLIGTYQAYLYGSMIAILFLLCNVFIFNKLLDVQSDNNSNVLSYSGIIGFSWPFIPHAMSGAVLSYIDRVMLQNMHGLESVGNYTFGYVLGSSIIMIYGVMATFYEPYVYKKANNEIRLHTLQTNYLFFLMLFSSLAGLLILVVVNHFEGLVSSKGYVNISAIAQIVLVAHLVYAYYTISNYQLTALKKTVIIASSTFLAGIINIGFNLILIPEYGEIGAAYSTLISFVFLVLYLGYKSRIVFKGNKLDKSRLLLAFILLLTAIVNLSGNYMYVVIMLVVLVLYCCINLYKNLELKRILSLWNDTKL